MAEQRHDPGAPFDVVVAGQSPTDPAEARRFFDTYADAGATWWSEDVNTRRGPLDEMFALVRRGPARQNE